jgi:hypothetical protein
MLQRVLFTLTTMALLGMQLGCGNKGYVAPENTITSSEANANPGLPENQRPSGFPKDSSKMGVGQKGQQPSGPPGGSPSGPPRK